MMSTIAGILRVIWKPVAICLALIALLELAKRGQMLPVFVPAPSDVFWEVWKNPKLLSSNLPPTAWKAATGYGIAACIAIVSASIAVSVRALYGPVYNVSVIINSIPVIATAPLLALWLGTGTQVQIAIAALSSQFPMLVGTMQGLQAADSRQRELMHVLSASRYQTLRYLLIPSALPYLFAGLKSAAPSAVLGAITAEWAGADQGVGAMMLYALFSYDPPKVWLSVVLTCLLAGAGFGIWAALERVAVYWHHEVELAD
jgi:ABC-type nitrate/sulfonate/bicarbonate transport system permease component